MSFNQKSDVKRHLSARQHKTLPPFRPMVQPDITNNSGDEARDENRDTPVSRQKSSLAFYAVIPITLREVPIGSDNLTDTLTVKKPQA